MTDTPLDPNAPHPHEDRLTDGLDVELTDPPTLTGPQAQGDVLVLPWLPSTAPAWRSQEIDAATPVPPAGTAATPDGSHVLLPEPGFLTAPLWTERRKGHALGTLVVPPGTVARLSHHEHADLLVGPGVYVVRQQRRYVAPNTAPAPAAD